MADKWSKPPFNRPERTMIHSYTSVLEQNVRTSRVYSLMDNLPLRACLFASETRVGYPGTDRNGANRHPDNAVAVYDAVAERVSYLDLDGERRMVTVPVGATPEAIASMVFALATIEEWSDGRP